MCLFIHDNIIFEEIAVRLSMFTSFKVLALNDINKDYVVDYFHMFRSYFIIQCILPIWLYEYPQSMHVIVWSLSLDSILIMMFKTHICLKFCKCFLQSIFFYIIYHAQTFIRANLPKYFPGWSWLMNIQAINRSEYNFVQYHMCYHFTHLGLYSHKPQIHQAIICGFPGNIN